jgi:hypothetical protein
MPGADAEFERPAKPSRRQPDDQERALSERLAVIHSGRPRGANQDNMASGGLTALTAALLVRWSVENPAHL